MLEIDASVMARDRSAPSSAASLVALAILAVCGEARANVGVTSWDPGVAGLTAIDRTRLEVERETLTFDCRLRDEKVVCDLEARYEVVNPADEPERVAAAFYGFLVSEVEIAIDGHAADADLTDEQLAAVDRAVEQVQRDLPGPRFARGPTLEGRGFALAVDAGGRRTVVVTGRVEPAGLFVPGYQMSAPQARHLVLGSVPDKRPATLVYPLAPLETWAGVGEIDITVRCSDDLDAAPKFSDRDGEGSDDSGESEDEGWRRGEDGDEQSWRYRGPYPGHDYLLVEIEESAPEILHGGPLLRLGGAVVQRREFRAGVGYEFAAPEWLFYAVHVETDFKQDLVIVPTLKAASPWLILIPWGAIGLGAPILVRPGESTAVGIRAELAIGWGPIALVVNLDFQPMLGPDDPYSHQIGIYGQVSI